MLAPAGRAKAVPSPRRLWVVEIKDTTQKIKSGDLLAETWMPFPRAYLVREDASNALGFWYDEGFRARIASYTPER